MLVTKKMNNNNTDNNSNMPNNFNPNDPTFNSANSIWWNNMSSNNHPMQQQDLQRQFLIRMSNMQRAMPADMNNNQNILLQQQQQQQQQQHVQQQQQQFNAQQYHNFQQQPQPQQHSITPNNFNNNNQISSMNYYNTPPRNMQQTQHHQMQQQQQQPQQQHQTNRAYLIATPPLTPQPQPQPQQQQQAIQQRNALHPAQQQRLVSVDGIQSGVPTLTTSTLTPTLMRSIEETFTELIEDTAPASFQAGFIPPTFPSTSSNTANSIGGTFNGSVHDYNDTESEDSRNSLGPRLYEDYPSLGGETTENSSATTDSTSFQNGLYRSSRATSNSNSASTNDFSAINVTIAAANASKKSSNNANTSSATSTSGTTTTRRNQGGRRPAKASNLSPEEEEKRRIRRERNKLAAARCRKRRVDLTNDLLDEVSILEKKRESLQKEIASLNTNKQELEYILEVHRPSCQKIREDLMSVTTFNGLIAPNNTTNDNITGIDTTLASTGRSSPIDLKPEIIHDNLLGIPRIKNEPLDSALDGSSLDHDGPPSPKRMLLTSNNPMVPPALPKIGTLSPSLAAASLNTPIVTTAPVSFANLGSLQNNAMVVNTLNALNKPLLNVGGGMGAGGGNSRQRPTTLPTMPRNIGLGLNVDKKAPTDINGVVIQTPSTGTFNFDSLMDGGTGLTPVQGPLQPTCSSQNNLPLESITPTSEPSKLVSL